MQSQSRSANSNQKSVRYSLSFIRGDTRLSATEILDWGARIASVGLFLLALIFALDVGSTFLIPVVTAVLIGFVFGPAVDVLEKRGINSYAASVFIILGLSLIGAALAYVLASPLEEWGRRLPEMWDRVLELLGTLRGPIDSLNEVSESLQDVQKPDKQPTNIVAVSDGGIVPQLLIVAPVLIGQVVIFLCTLYFFLANRTRLRGTVLSFCMSSRGRLRTARIFRDIEYFLSRYVGAITVVNIGLGVATAVTMALLGMPAPVLWGALAAVFNFVPYIGPAVVAATLAGVGLVTFDTVLAGLLPAAAFVGLNVIESQFVTPGFIGRTLTINPFAVFLALVFWMWLWGPLGGLVAVPALIVALVVLIHILPRRDTASTRRYGRPVQRMRKPATRPSGDEIVTPPLARDPAMTDASG